jgi:glycosyltransferase involved in cell wall biosynthesis
MRILLLTDGIHPYVIGGMQKYSYYLAKYLVDSGADVCLVHCVPSGKRIPSSEDVRAELGCTDATNLEIIGMHFPARGSMPGHYLKESYAYSIKIFNTLKERLSDFDFIYAQGFCGWKFAEEKAKGKSLPKLGIHFHGYEMYQKTHGLKAWVGAYLLRSGVQYNVRHADAVFSFGGEIDKILSRLNVNEQKRLITSNGVEEGMLAVSHTKSFSDQKRFVFIGRYERRKGVEELNIALNQLQNENPAGWSFDFVGNIPGSKKLKAPNVKYHGVISDQQQLKTLLRNADVLVCPSLAEGMPTVILEAMAQGLAVIATDTGAVSRMVDAANGWILPTGDVPALLQCLKSVLATDVDHLDRLKTDSLRKVKEHFLWKEVFQQEFAHIRNLVKK